MRLECFFYRCLKYYKNPLVVQYGESCPGYVYRPIFREDPHVAYFAEAWWIVNLFKERCEKSAKEQGVHLDRGGLELRWFDKCLYRISLKDAEDLLNGIKNLPNDRMESWTSDCGKNKDELIVEAEKLVKTMKEESDYDYYFIAWW